MIELSEAERSQIWAYRQRELTEADEALCARIVLAGWRLSATWVAITSFNAGIEAGIERAARLFDTHPIDADRAAKVRALKASA